MKVGLQLSGLVFAHQKDLGVTDLSLINILVSTPKAVSPFRFCTFCQKGKANLFACVSLRVGTWFVPLGGNVGIGTTYPNYKLDINGDISISGS